MLHQYKGERIPPYEPLSHLLPLDSFPLSLDFLFRHRNNPSPVIPELFSPLP